VALNRASFNGNNYGSPTSELQFGPYNLGSCTKLLRVTASLVNTYLTGDLVIGQAVVPALVWGVQWVPHGNSPLNLPASAFHASFLWAKIIHDDANIAFTWSPSTDTAGNGSVDAVTEEWRGQLPIGMNIDLYVTAGYLLSGSFTFQGAHNMVVINTT